MVLISASPASPSPILARCKISAIVTNGIHASASNKPAAMTLRAGGHIRVTLVLGRLQPPARRIMEIAASLVATLFVGFLAIAMARFAWTAFTSGQTSISSGTMLWIPEAVIAFGMVLLALQFLARFIQALLGLPLEDHRIKAAPVE